MAPITVFVCGVTGVQGGATARALLSQGAQVHSVTRNPSSASSKEFEALGVKFWPGNFDDEAALKAAINRCSSIYLNFYPDFTDLSANLRQAKLIMSIALASGAKHVVYTSVLGTNDPESVTAWDPKSLVAGVHMSKVSIEAAVRAAGFESWTILRPAVFMTNYLAPVIDMYGDFARTGTWKTALREDTQIPLIAPVTMGAFGAAALLNPEKYQGREIGYADQLLSPRQVVEELSRAGGKKLDIYFYTEEEVDSLKSVNPFVGGELITRRVVRFVDIEKVQAEGIPLTSFREFLEGEKTRAVATFAGI